MGKVGLVALVLGTLLGGCENPKDRLVRTGANGITRPATITEQYDGSYQGRAVLIRGSRPVCPVRPRIGVAEIGDGVLTFPYVPAVILTAPVQADGSLHAQTLSAVLDGRIVNHDQLRFTITTPACETVYTMWFVWNHS